jgi:pimeloyl-ACP methyl ester carboxylesterase
MAEFVLVHGAWHGGWVWSRVARMLRAHGHEVHAPTLTGLGERSHLLGPDIGVETHVLDLLGVLRSRDLTDVTLVAHSYGGMPARVAADREPGRVSRIVLVDAFSPPAGVSVFEDSPAWFSETVRGFDRGDGILATPPAAMTGVVDADDLALVAAHLTPHPLRTFEDGPALTGAVNDIPCRAIVSTPEAGVPFAEWARRDGFPCVEVPGGHDLMLTSAKELADELTRR